MGGSKFKEVQERPETGTCLEDMITAISFCYDCVLGSRLVFSSFSLTFASISIGICFIWFTWFNVFNVCRFSLVNNTSKSSLSV